MATAAPGPTRDLGEAVRACTACHGDEGRAGPDGYYPRIAGKPADYLFAQLLHFRDGRRPYDLMRRLLAPLSDEHMADIAAHFSRQKPPFPAPARQPLSMKDAALAQRLIDQGDTARGLSACRDCHGADLMGAPPTVPGLLGLPRDYLNAQLGAWREGLRRSFEPDCMARIARQLTPQEVSALTGWLSTRAVVSSPKLSASAGRAAASAASTPGVDECSKLPAGPGANTTAQDIDGRASAQRTSPPANELIERGAYLVNIGNCAGCHTTSDGSPFAGGKPIATPFGDVMTSNLTPDHVTGLGAWSTDDFWRALREGISRDGRLLYPAFPYPHYSGLVRADADAMFAWLRTLPPRASPVQHHRLIWPANSQWALRWWRALFFRPLDWSASTGQSEAWNRGRYLVETLGHCGACHTPRNRLGAPDAARALQGARMPASAWFAPALRATNDDPQVISDRATLATLLTTGASAAHRMSGPMAEIVTASLRHLSTGDAQAISVYLAEIATPQTASTATAKAPASIRASASGQLSTGGQASGSERGRDLHERHCADCHGKNGEGHPPHYPALAGNRTVLMNDAANFAQVVLYGAFGLSVPGAAVPYGMPPFVLTLDDGELASLLNFVRGAWGNHATRVDVQDIARLRGQKAH